MKNVFLLFHALIADKNEQTYNIIYQELKNSAVWYIT